MLLRCHGCTACTRARLAQEGDAGTLHCYSAAATAGLAQAQDDRTWRCKQAERIYPDAASRHNAATLALQA